MVNHYPIPSLNVEMTNDIKYVITADADIEYYDAVVKIPLTCSLQQVQDAFMFFSEDKVLTVGAPENIYCAMSDDRITNWVFPAVDHLISTAKLQSLVNTNVPVGGTASAESSPYNTSALDSSLKIYSTLYASYHIQDQTIAETYTSFTAQSLFNSWQAESILHNIPEVQTKLNTDLDSTFIASIAEMKRVGGAGGHISAFTIRDPNVVLRLGSTAPNVYKGFIAASALIPAVYGDDNVTVLTPAVAAVPAYYHPILSMIKKIPANVLTDLQPYLMTGNSLASDGIDATSGGFATINADTTVNDYSIFAHRFPFKENDIISCLVKINPAGTQTSISTSDAIVPYTFKLEFVCPAAVTTPPSTVPNSSYATSELVNATITPTVVANTRGPLLAAGAIVQTYWNVLQVDSISTATASAKITFPAGTKVYGQLIGAGGAGGQLAYDGYSTYTVGGGGAGGEKNSFSFVAAADVPYSIVVGAGGSFTQNLDGAATTFVGGTISMVTAEGGANGQPGVSPTYDLDGNILTAAIKGVGGAGHNAYGAGGDDSLPAGGAAKPNNLLVYPAPITLPGSAEINDALGHGGLQGQMNILPVGGVGKGQGGNGGNFYEEAVQVPFSGTAGQAFLWWEA